MKSDNMKRHIWKSSLGIVSYRRKVYVEKNVAWKLAKRTI